jgi:hypothetical protein
LYRSNNVPVFSKGRFRAMPKHSRKGIPDITLIHPTSGRYIGIEVKKDDGVLSTDQEEFERLCHREQWRLHRRAQHR